jgi:predicted CXXCH cytochrome family protein
MPLRRSILVVTVSAAVALASAWSAAATKSQPKPVDWAALNPAFAGATFVKDAETCRTCHEGPMHTYSGTKHAKAFAAHPPETAGDCESCHGPRSKHIEDPEINFAIAPSSGAQSAICLQCHQGGSRFSWKAGAHHSTEVTCTSCHTVMAPASERALLTKSSVTETCYQCHAEVRTEANKMSHHPLREGRMDCASCHTEKRGPFVWEHAPVRESCATCHTPHGSNQRNLLTNKDPFLCLSCHSYGGHINLPRYNRVSNPYGTGCSNCHVSVHGSNHPSGAKLTR